MKPHKCECECMECRYGSEYVAQWEQEQILKFGWFTHFVGVGDECGPMGVDFHTHGIAFKYNHPDLQIVLPLEPKIANGIFWSCVDHIKNGEKFYPWDTAKKIAGNGYRVKFVPVAEGNGDASRHVLRIIIPDKHGHLDSDNLTGGFESQYDDIDESQLPVSIEEMKLTSLADTKKYSHD